MGGVTHISRLEVRGDEEHPDGWAQDSVIVELPIALVYNGISHAVMMATPTDLEDFATGFSLSEGIIESPAEIYSFEQVRSEQGLSLQLTISARREAALTIKRKRIGATSCGMCGIESLAEAAAVTPAVQAPALTPEAIQHALGLLKDFQPLQGQTGASHAAAWCGLNGDIRLAREDAGRHNALDKVIGAVARQRLDVQDGFALVSSRASFEMVQKSCRAGMGVLVAVSAPTSMAIERARAAGQLLVGFGRKGRHIIYNLPQRSSADQ